MNGRAIERGAMVVCACAYGRDRVNRALTGVVAGGDFPVVWACSPREWNAASAEGRDPDGIPWPAGDVRLVGAARKAVGE
jgi:hypothetical protein